MRVGFRKPSGHAVGRDFAFGSDSERIFPTRAPQSALVCIFPRIDRLGATGACLLCEFDYLRTGFTMKTPRPLL